MLKKKNIIKVALLVAVLLVSSYGCRPAERPAPDMNQQQNRQEGQMAQDNTGFQGGNVAGNRDARTRGERLANEIVDLQGINDAAVIIYRNTAIVAVDVPRGQEDLLTEDMAYRINNVVMANEGEITDILITADEEVFEQVDNIAHAIVRGESEDEHSEEIQEIINRIREGR